MPHPGFSHGRGIMPELSIVIPTYNNCQFVEACIRSATTQSFQDIEVIVVDDASTDSTLEVLDYLAKQDKRITVIRHPCNKGTLQSRKTGVLAASGQFILLIDQDDEFAKESFAHLHDFSQQHPADIYHFAVNVDAASTAAQAAAQSMQQALRPRYEQLHGTDILRWQFDPSQGFDWSVHHRMFRRDLLKRAYSLVPDTTLVLADDFLMTFIVDSLAIEYRSTNQPWYIYHLGRGETYNRLISLTDFLKINHWNSTAFNLVSSFIRDNAKSIHRPDWKQRKQDALDKIIEQNMSEWRNLLSVGEQLEALSSVRAAWPSDSICAELYRFARDDCYAYLTRHSDDTAETNALRNTALLYFNLANAMETESGFNESNNQRLQLMKTTAISHLRDSGLISA